VEKFLLNKTAQSVFTVTFKGAFTVALLATMITTSGCGRRADDAPIDGGVDEFTTTGSITEKGQGEYEGSGAMRFLRTLSSAQTSQALTVRANLFSASSKIEFVMFATNTNLSDGLHFTLTPVIASNTIVGTIDLNSVGVRTVNSSRLQSFNANPLNMVIDFHGYGNAARVIVYPYDAPSTSTLMMDTSRNGDLNMALPNTMLTGIFYGILMTDAHISTAHLRPAVAGR
jgi:hypothetical protein